MKKIIGEISNTIEIKKSKFITNIYRVNSFLEANETLAKTKKKYYDASHNTYAYIIGDDKETLIKKSSDDGEPSKTAGAPILSVIEHNDLTNILVIVTRYFGGTLLGTGGLVKAYSSSVIEALKKANYANTIKCDKYLITLSYPAYNNILNLLTDVKILNQSFLENVILEVAIDTKASNSFKKEIALKTSGEAIITLSGTYFFDSLL